MLHWIEQIFAQGALKDTDRIRVNYAIGLAALIAIVVKLKLLAVGHRLLVFTVLVDEAVIGK